MWTYIYISNKLCLSKSRVPLRQFAFIIAWMSFSNCRGLFFHEGFLCPLTTFG
uniref:Uncharacterized protein n=1 Tax=Rhizophora mucronata TaxID=61149 RepID=A0A2P2R2L5_RHIMU